MSELLDKAVAELRKLSPAEQDAIAALILEEISDEQQWDDALARSPDKLRSLADRAMDQVRSGQCRTAGFDEL